MLLTRKCPQTTTTDNDIMMTIPLVLPRGKNDPEKVCSGVRKIFSAILVEINAFRGDAMKTISAVFEVRPFQVIG